MFLMLPFFCHNICFQRLHAILASAENSKVGSLVLVYFVPLILGYLF